MRLSAVVYSSGSRSSRSDGRQSRPLSRELVGQIWLMYCTNIARPSHTRLIATYTSTAARHLGRRSKIERGLGL